jgi:precorrin-3B C17-methyltransferase
MAKEALQQSDAVVGYGLYLNWIQPWIEGKEIHTLPLTQERERAALALNLARTGRRVSLVSSGDIGVYGLAPLVFEMLEPGEQTQIQLIPGITAAQSCASMLGAPLGHDFATLSLSDLLCPWPWIEHRARHIAQADLALVLYNVQSQARQEGVYRILDILLEHRPGGIWCGVVRNAYREDASSEICTLEELRRKKFDMLTTLVIGTRFTKKTGRFLFAPRGYLGWESTSNPAPDAVWFFTGTRDGNLLAHASAQTGVKTVISVASEHGAVQAREHSPGSHVVAGRIGEAARRKLLEASKARAIVDATHPFATRISEQLIRICSDLGIPYLRFERPRREESIHTQSVADIPAAAREAVRQGKRIFLSTGVKDLSAFLAADPEGSALWFARVTPSPDSLTRALGAGIPASRLCAIQGPFSEEANTALWREWKIDCVVTKESGETGGLPSKIAAARALGIPIIVVARPAMQYPEATSHFEDVQAWLSRLSTSPAQSVRH